MADKTHKYKIDQEISPEGIARTDLSNVASDLSEAEKTVIKDKIGVTEGGGSTPSVEKTGSSIVLIENANYNQTTPFTGSAATVSSTGAKDTVIKFFANTASEVAFTGATRIMKTGTFKPNVLTIYWLTWMGTGYNLNVQSNTE